MKCCNCKNLGKLKDEDGAPYNWCEKVCDCPSTTMERNCKHYAVASNADRIRSMTDEELAHILKLTAKGGIIGQRSEEAWLDWLRQEVTTNSTT